MTDSCRREKRWSSLAGIFYNRSKYCRHVLKEHVFIHVLNMIERQSHMNERNPGHLNTNDLSTYSIKHNLFLLFIFPNTVSCELSLVQLPLRKS